EQTTEDAHRELAALRKEAYEARQGVRGVRAETAAAEEGLISVLGKLQQSERRPAETTSSEGRNRLGVTVEPGGVVAEVLPVTPAGEAGLAPGDLIRNVNGSPVLTGAEMRDVIAGVKDGEDVTLQITRGGVVKVITARLEAPSEDEESPEEHNRLGVTVEPGV